MQLPDQMSARAAATKFIDANSGQNNLMAVVEFGGALRILQNFTANADLLKRAASGVKATSVASNMDSGNSGFVADIPAMSSISSAEADFGARTMLLAIRSLAKNLRSVPGRKMLVLISAGFPLTPETQSELTATLDACNKANVAIYALDARGLLAGALQNNPGLRPTTGGRLHDASLRGNANATSRPRFILTAYPEPQRPRRWWRWNRGRNRGGPEEERAAELVVVAAAEPVALAELAAPAARAELVARAELAAQAVRAELAAREERRQGWNWWHRHYRWWHNASAGEHERIQQSV